MKVGNLTVHGKSLERFTKPIQRPLFDGTGEDLQNVIIFKILPGQYSVGLTILLPARWSVATVKISETVARCAPRTASAASVRRRRGRGEKGRKGLLWDR